jgi:hypothetical protein
MQNFALFCELKMKKGAKNHCSCGFLCCNFLIFYNFFIRKGCFNCYSMNSKVSPIFSLIIGSRFWSHCHSSYMKRSWKKKWLGVIDSKHIAPWCSMITCSKGRHDRFSWSFFTWSIHPSIHPIIHPWMTSYREERPW